MLWAMANMNIRGYFGVSAASFIRCIADVSGPAFGASTQLYALNAHHNHTHWRANGLGFVRHQVRKEDKISPIAFKTPGSEPKSLALRQAVNRGSTF